MFATYDSYKTAAPPCDDALCEHCDERMDLRCRHCGCELCDAHFEEHIEDCREEHRCGCGSLSYDACRCDGWAS